MTRTKLAAFGTPRTTRPATRRSLAVLALAAVLALGCAIPRQSRSSAPPPDVAPGTGSGGFRCTQVVGFSQTRQWFGGLEQVVDGAHWQLVAEGGASVDRWADPGFEGWGNRPASACVEGATAPDRVVLNVSGGFGTDEAAWVGQIERAVATVRQRVPSARRIVLQPVVGGPGGSVCESWLGGDVRASVIHPVIARAIERVAGGDVVAGPEPTVDSCRAYADPLGHLRSNAAERVGREIGAAYRDGA